MTSALKFRVSYCQTEGPSVYRAEASSVYSCLAPLAILRRRAEAPRAFAFLNLETIMSKSFGAASTTDEVLEGLRESLKTEAEERIQEKAKLANILARLQRIEAHLKFDNA